MSINVVTISGNVGADARLSATPTGTQVLQFSVAVNDRVKNNQTGAWEDRPNWVDCVIFGQRAESLAPYLTKGTKVAVFGRLHWSSWEKDGQKRSKLDVIVSEVEFLSARSQQAAPTQQAPQRKAPTYAPQQQAPQQRTYQPQNGSYVYDENLPF